MNELNSSIKRLNKKVKSSLDDKEETKQNDMLWFTMLWFKMTCYGLHVMV